MVFFHHGILGISKIIKLKRLEQNNQSLGVLTAGCSGGGGVDAFRRWLVIKTRFVCLFVYSLEGTSQVGPGIGKGDNFIR